MAELSDIERDKLMTRLERFESKYDDMTLGESVKQVSHANGNGGARDVSFAAGDMNGIKNEIRALRKQLGMSAPTFDASSSRHPIQMSAH